jgi:hypothetical protein
MGAGGEVRSREQYALDRLNVTTRVAIEEDVVGAVCLSVEDYAGA